MNISSFMPLLQAVMEPTCLVDPVSQCVLGFNQAAADLIGLEATDLVGRRVTAFLATPEDLVFWQEAAVGVVDRLHSESFVLNAYGLSVPVERHVQRASSDEGSSVYVVGMRDLRRQRQVVDDLEGVVAELRATLDSSTDGILVCDRQGAIRSYNRKFAQLWEIPNELLQHRDDPAIHAHQAQSVTDPVRYLERMSQIEADPKMVTTDLLLMRSGRILERETQPQLTRGISTGRVYTFRDISQRVEAESGLQLAAKVFEFCPDAVFITDADYQILVMNPVCERLTGLSQKRSRKFSARDLFQGTEGQSVFALVEQGLKNQGYWEGELRRRNADMGFLVVYVSWVMVRNEQGEVLHSIGFINDMTEKLLAKEKIEQLAYSDALTGLPNRLLLSKQVDIALEVAQRQGGQFAILFLDLDRFKNINDSMGHAFGDVVLIEVAERIKKCLRDVDTLSRLGGDEFVILLQDAQALGAELVARRLITTLSLPFQTDGMSYSLGASIGVALYPGDGQTLDELSMHADAAMYRVKERGRGNYCFYQTQMNADHLPRMKMDHAMRQALEKNLFRLHYQPQIAMSTGHLIGAEALIRWTDPELGPISPAVFIPIAEESGLIVSIGNWVLGEAVRQAAIWQRTGHPVAVAVNVSALQFQQTDFVERIESALKKEGLHSDLLELELTESILVADADEALARLHALADIGVTLSIDDFGTGYSSLSYLKRFPISKLKIDRSFVMGLPGDDSDRAIVSATIGMARALKLRVIAEGVETEDQRSLLCELNCDSYQGYLCSPGVAPEVFEQLVLKLASPCLDLPPPQITFEALNSSICAAP